MKAYLDKVRTMLENFGKWQLTQISRGENQHADVLVKLAPSLPTEFAMLAMNEAVKSPSINQGLQARKLRLRATRYVIIGETLYKRGFSMPYLRCILLKEAECILKEVHEGIGGSHVAKRSLAQRIVRHGYYWPSMEKGCIDFFRNCDKCQKNLTVPRQPPQMLTQ